VNNKPYDIPKQKYNHTNHGTSSEMQVPMAMLPRF